MNILKRFQISNKGFLPEKCNNILPTNFTYLQIVSDNISEKQTNAAEFRKIIDNLPEYDTNKHTTNTIGLDEKQNLYSLLMMTVNRYVWCSGIDDAKNYSVIPKIISIPLVEISNYLGIVPSLTHAAVDLWNWHIIDNTKPFSFENIDTNHSLTGDITEQWFYRVMIAIEGTSGNMVKNIALYDPKTATYNDSKKLLSCIRQTTNHNVELISRIFENCDTEYFFNYVRIYLSGSKKKCLPNGITLKTMTDNIIIKHDGGSAAQSSLIPILDVLFNIEHPEHGGDFLRKMRNYMPRFHREFITFIEDRYKDFSRSILESNDSTLIGLYHDSIVNLMQFRKTHTSLIHNYIMKFIEPQNRMKIVENKQVHGKKGAGGMLPREFAREINRDTYKVLKYVSDIRVKAYKKSERYRYVKYMIYMIIIGLCMWKLIFYQ